MGIFGYGFGAGGINGGREKLVMEGIGKKWGVGTEKHWMHYGDRMDEMGGRCGSVMDEPWDKVR